MRSLLRSVVSADPTLEVAGTAADGASALGSLASMRPDLVLLDVEMPVMNGLVTLRELRKRGHKMPVIMCSSLTQRGAKVTLEALAGGASDYVAKPVSQSNREQAIRALSQELSPKIHALTQREPGLSVAAQLGVNPAQSVVPGIGAPPTASPRLPVFPGMSPATSRGPLAFPAAPQRIQPASRPAVVVIGVSTGGPAALETVLPALPADFPVPILIVQHMPELLPRSSPSASMADATCAYAKGQKATQSIPGPFSSLVAIGTWKCSRRRGATRRPRCT
jgi:two-component system chemotaxis response regulator CheB